MTVSDAATALRPIDPREFDTSGVPAGPVPAVPAAARPPPGLPGPVPQPLGHQPLRGRRTPRSRTTRASTAPSTTRRAVPVRLEPRVRSEHPRVRQQRPSTAGCATSWPASSSARASRTSSPSSKGSPPSCRSRAGGEDSHRRCEERANRAGEPVLEPVPDPRHLQHARPAAGGRGALRGLVPGAHRRASASAASTSPGAWRRATRCGPTSSRSWPSGWRTPATTCSRGSVVAELDGRCA